MGGICEHSYVGRCVQDVDVTLYADSIDLGSFIANFGGFMSSFSGTDLPEMNLVFLDTNGMELGTSNTLSTLNANWTMFSEWTIIPAQTRTIQFGLKGTRNGGEDNDSYFDDLFLKVGTENINCGDVTSVVNQAITSVANFNLI